MFRSSRDTLKTFFWPSHKARSSAYFGCLRLWSHSSARYFLTLDWGRPASRNQAADPHDCSYSTEMTPPSIGEHRARSATQEVKVNRLELLPTSMRIYFLVTWNPFSGSGWRKVNWSRNRLLSRHVNSWIRFTVDWLLSGIKEKRIRKISLFEK